MLLRYWDHSGSKTVIANKACMFTAILLLTRTVLFFSILIDDTSFRCTAMQWKTSLALLVLTSLKIFCSHLLIKEREDMDVNSGWLVVSVPVSSHAGITQSKTLAHS